MQHRRLRRHELRDLLQRPQLPELARGGPPPLPHPSLGYNSITSRTFVCSSNHNMNVVPQPHSMSLFSVHTNVQVSTVQLRPGLLTPTGQAGSRGGEAAGGGAGC